MKQKGFFAFFNSLVFAISEKSSIFTFSFLTKNELLIAQRYEY